MVNRLPISAGIRATRRPKDLTLFAVFIATVVCGLCCSAGTHNGSMQDSDEPATLMTEYRYGTDLRKIDGGQVAGSSFEILPGRHRVEVSGTYKENPANGANMVAFGVIGVAAGAMMDRSTPVHSGPLLACFIARPGHTYVVRTLLESGAWKVEIFDRETTYDVQSPCKTPRKP
jgi:hypothetical protein